MVQYAIVFGVKNMDLNTVAQVVAIKQQPISADYPDENRHRQTRPPLHQLHLPARYSPRSGRFLSSPTSNVCPPMSANPPSSSSSPHVHQVTSIGSAFPLSFPIHFYPSYISYPSQIHHQGHTHCPTHIHHLPRSTGSSRHPTWRNAADAQAGSARW